MQAGIQEQLDGWESEDGIPRLCLKQSDAAKAKWVFQPRVVRKTESTEETVSSEDSEETEVESIEDGEETSEEDQSMSPKGSEHVSEELHDGDATQEEVQ